MLNFSKPGAETVDHLKFLQHPVLYTNADFLLLQWYVNDVEGDDKKSQRPRPLTIPYELRKYSALFFLANQQIVQLQSRLGFLESYGDYLLRRFDDPQSEPSLAAKMVFERFVEVCKERGLPLGLVIFPAGSASDFLLDRVIALSEAHGTRYVDLRSTFAPYKQDPRKLWANRLDSHPGPMANSLVTDQLMDVFAKNWLPESVTLASKDETSHRNHFLER